MALRHEALRVAARRGVPLHDRVKLLPTEADRATFLDWLLRYELRQMHEKADRDYRRFVREATDEAGSVSCGDADAAVCG